MLARRMQNFFRDATKRILENPLGRCSPEVVEARLKICQACPMWAAKKFSPNGTCTHIDCGCHGGQSNKIYNMLTWPTKECPEGRWSAQTSQTDEQYIDDPKAKK